MYLCQDPECKGSVFCKDCVEILDREEANINGDNISLEAYNERF